jgi:putative copper resistance protein D
MMLDGWLVPGRLALYAGLMLAFGVPSFVLQTMGGSPAGLPIVRRLIRMTGAAVVLSLVASGIGFWTMAQGMSGSSDPGAVKAVAWTLLTQTSVGWAWEIRVVLLIGSLCFVLVPKVGVRVRAAVLALLGAGALATLAWAGHGNMSEGAEGWLHLVADIAHLVVAGAWVGALAVLTLMATMASRQEAPEDILQRLSRAASGFARTGTLIVVVLVVSGVINYLLIVGPSLSGLIASTYGRLLLVKLGIFAAMLVLAAANRFRLAPALAHKLRNHDAAGAVTSLKRSLWIETTLAATVLGLVAWLGTLDPAG